MGKLQLLELFKFRNIVQWLTAVWMYLLLFPYFAWEIEPYASWLIQLPLVAFLLLYQSKNVDYIAVFSFGLISFIAALCNGANLFGILMSFTNVLIFSTKKSFLIGVYNKYRYIYIILIMLSLISYILVTIGVSLPYHISPPPPRNTIEYNYHIYPFFASPSVDDWRQLGLNRFNGLFDEPGVVGTISFLLLFIDKFNFKKVGNIILLISGIMSFSLFFYLALFICLCYKVIIDKVTLHKKIILMGCVFLGLFAVSTNEVTRVLIFDRVTWDETANTIAGDNRSSESLKNYVHSIRGTSAYFWGKPEMVNQFKGSASLEKQILAYGFVTLFLFFLFFAIYSMKYLHISRKWIMFYIVFFIIMYNRPTMFSKDRLMLITMAIYAYSDMYKALFLTGINNKNIASITHITYNPYAPVSIEKSQNINW